MHHTSHHQNAVKNVIFFLTTVIIIIAIFVVGYSFGRRDFLQTEHFVSLTQANVFHKENKNNVDFSLFWRAWDLLHRNYVDRDHLDARMLVQGAIAGMYHATGDPYTTFLNREHNQELAEELEGSFEGIGAELGMRDDILTVIAPLDASPAQKAGLMSGDKIIAINHESALDLSIDEAVERIRGPRGTDVVLTVFRDAMTEPEDITITRDRIKIDSVRTEPLTDDRIAYIRIAQFGEDTDRDFLRILQTLHKKHVRGIIIDLRNNPGGYLNTAVDMIARFVPKGATALVTVQQDGTKEFKQTHAEPIIQDLPIVILINEGSASAAEIFAGALRAHYPHVTLIGKKSFGKGSVQELFPLSKDIAAKITVAKWLTPDEKQIDGVGIMPDEEVEYTREDYEADRDPQRDRAREVLRSQLSQK